MTKFSFNIADIIFSVSTNDSGPELHVSTAYSRFLVHDCKRNPDIEIQILHGNPLHDGFIKVFTAKHPVSGEILWTVFKHNDVFCFLIEDKKNAERTLCAITTSDFRAWSFFFSENCEHVELFSFPAGMLLINYSVIFMGGIMLHASAVHFKGKGLLFTGQSGAGKTTIAELFQSAGGTIINDDRIIIRKVDKEIKIHNTPMWYEEVPRSVRLCECFNIHHASVNSLSPVRNIFEFWPSVVQHNFDKGIIMQQMSLFSSIFQSIPLQHLGFVPNIKIISFLQNIHK